MHFSSLFVVEIFFRVAIACWKLVDGVGHMHLLVDKWSALKEEEPNSISNWKPWANHRKSFKPLQDHTQTSHFKPKISGRMWQVPTTWWSLVGSWCGRSQHEEWFVGSRIWFLVWFLKWSKTGLKKGATETHPVIQKCKLTKTSQNHLANLGTTPTPQGKQSCMSCLAVLKLPQVNPLFRQRPFTAQCCSFRGIGLQVRRLSPVMPRSQEATPPVRWLSRKDMEQLELLPSTHQEVLIGDSIRTIRTTNTHPLVGLCHVVSCCFMVFLEIQMLLAELLAIESIIKKIWMIVPTVRGRCLLAPGGFFLVDLVVKRQAFRTSVATI